MDMNPEDHHGFPFPYATYTIACLKFPEYGCCNLCTFCIYFWWIHQSRRVWSDWTTLGLYRTTLEGLSCSSVVTLSIREGKADKKRAGDCHSSCFHVHSPAVSSINHHHPRAQTQVTRVGYSELFYNVCSLRFRKTATLEGRLLSRENQTCHKFNTTIQAIYLPPSVAHCWPGAPTTEFNRGPT